MAVASILGVCFTLAGLCLSYVYDLASGATIILVAGIGFFVFQMIGLMKRRGGCGP
jgi:zinc transport system permease protein